MSIEGEGWHIRTPEQRQALIEYIEANSNSEIVFKVIRPNRTTRQNNALHAYLREIAEQMNARGMDMRQVLKPTVEIAPTMQLIKDYMWRPIQKILTGKESTEQLTTTEVDKVYQEMSKHLAANLDIQVQFGKVQ
tara:strand:- start:317 stop:721 length:405 start_codon:yes stop_codon:yes gene_type:complete